jgi:hypothetical protein
MMLHYILLPQINFLLTLLLYTAITWFSKECKSKLKILMIAANLLQFQFMDLNWLKIFTIHEKNPIFTKQLKRTILIRAAFRFALVYISHPSLISS